MDLPIWTCNTRREKESGEHAYMPTEIEHLAQLNYILVNKKRINSALNCEAYNSFATMNFNHRIVTARIRLSLIMHKNNSRKNLWLETTTNWSQHQNTIEVQNRFNELQAQIEDQNDADI